jgi:hypothetical protein
VRKVARTVVVLLLLASAASFVAYIGIHASLNDPSLPRRLRQIAANAHLVPRADAGPVRSARAMQRHASFVLQLGAATGLLATVSLIVLVVIDRRARRWRSDDDEEDDDDEEQAALRACPECYEPIKGVEAVCRECGHRFGPGSWPRRG